MKKDLVMYYPPDLEIVFVHTEREYVIDFIDNVRFNRLLKRHKNLRNKGAQESYDHI